MRSFLQNALVPSTPILLKFGNRPFDVVCWRVIIQNYQIVFKILSLSIWWSSG